jgi:cytochrome oxidase Cu insertion factor (SCO1/SenC/PrrC family)
VKLFGEPDAEPFRNPTVRPNRILALAAAFIIPVVGFTQPRVARGRGGELPLKVGDTFPLIEVFDAHGKAFSTKSLKGKYTVVVNGCLT